MYSFRNIGMIGSFVMGMFLMASESSAQKFLPDDPLWEDPDRVLSIPRPTERPLSKTIDLFQKTFKQSKQGPKEAQNLNTLGEVPNSSWFTNRMSRRVLSIDELVRGPDQGNGPDLSEPWLVVGAKTEGITPGLRIKDAKGDIYFIKFDPPYWPQMATSTEVIGTKFFHAFGYNVPENYLVRWKPVYRIEEDAEVLWETGHRERLTHSYVRDVLRDVPLRPDGTTQVVASKFLDGRPIGPFDFQGVRTDDPNDIVLHEDRRELRALRLFAAWMNHNDSDSVNTLDMYSTSPEGVRYVKHYLIDFGTVFGSGAHQPHARRVGNEYYIEIKPALKSALTLGFWDRPWRHIRYQEYRPIGRFESDYFRPDEWRPDYPNPAFDKMTLQDALWVTRTVLRFSDEAIRAMVQLGQIDDPAAEEHLIRTLIARRNKILHHYLGLINPLDDFRVVPEPAGARLVFSNLGVTAGLGSGCSYRYTWFRFDNKSGETEPLTSRGEVGQSSLSIPKGDHEFLMARISTLCSERPLWESRIDVYLKDSGKEIVGIERHDPE